METTKTHGGARAGAGRKRSDNPLVTFYIRVPPELLKKLRAARTSEIRAILERFV